MLHVAAKCWFGSIARQQWLSRECPQKAVHCAQAGKGGERKIAAFGSNFWFERKSLSSYSAGDAAEKELGGHHFEPNLRPASATDDERRGAAILHLSSAAKANGSLVIPYQDDRGISYLFTDDRLGERIEATAGDPLTIGRDI